MKSLILVSVLIAVNATLLTDPAKQFQDFKLDYDKIYKNQAEETKRFNIFKENLRSIEKHNELYGKGLKSYKLGINVFSDQSSEELENWLTPIVVNKTKYQSSRHILSRLEIPESIDWRIEGQVTEVRSQKKCRTAWAFAVTGSIEAAYYRKSGKLIPLSEQQLLNCGNTYQIQCGGFYDHGYLYMAFPYIIENGLQSWESYPYTAENDGCKYSASDVVTKVSSYVEMHDENDLLDAVANIGPIAITMDATRLYQYDSGIYTDSEAVLPNHSALVVGYGAENGTDFWIVKNCWGPKWGENGFFRIRRGTNECRLARHPTYPIIN